MAAFSVQMDGSKDYTLTLNVSQSSQDYGDNESVVAWSLVAAGSWGSYGGYSTSYSVTINGTTYAGTIPSFNPNPSQTIRSGTTPVKHNADGTKTISVSGSWDSRHPNIGKGTVNGSLTLSRIPKPPDAPGVPTLSNITPTGMRATWTGSPDSNGASITGQQLQYATDPAFANQVAAPIFGASIRSYDVPGLTPSTDYYYRTRAKNSQGWGPWSAARKARTLSGYYVWNGSAWRPGAAFVWTGTAWAVAEIFVWDGNAWTPTT